MANLSTYEGWKQEIDRAKRELLGRDVLLRQYALWLEASEDVTRYKGEDVYAMLLGSLHAISGVDFFPGIGYRNFVAVIGAVQKETGLDLGVCEFLVDRARESAKAQYNLSASSRMASCQARAGLGVADLRSCLPPNRVGCEHRIKALAKVRPSGDSGSV